MSVIALSTLDHVFFTDAVAPMQVVLHYRAELNAARLEECFAATAREFVGVNGVLTQIDEHTLGLDLSREAAVFSVATAGPEMRLADCLDAASSEIGKPVARLRVTRLGQRGTAVTFSMSHTVADGYGYFLFLSALAARYRAEPFFTPSCDRASLGPIPPSDVAVPTRPGKLAHSGFLLVGDDERRPMRLEERFLPISELKESPRGNPNGSFSSSDFLGAMVWKDILAGEPCAETTLTCAVDLRKHRANAGPLFFGNASFLASKTIAMDTLRSAPTEEIALGLRAAILDAPKHVEAGLAELEALRRHGGLAAMLRLRSVRPDGGLVFSNLSKIPLSALDFGSGPPAAMERTTTPVPHERACTVLAAGDKLRLFISRP